MEETVELEAGQACLIRRSRLLAKWVRVLFWLVIPSMIASAMTGSRAASAVPGLDLPGEILSVATVTAYALVLLRLDSVDRHYRYAAICILLMAACSAGMIFLSVTAHTEWMVLLLLPSSVLDLLAMYFEYTAHRYGTAGIDEGMSRKWKNLWYWNVGVLLAMLAGVVLAALGAGVLGMLATTAGGAGTLVLSVLKLCYLHQTAAICKAYSADK